jgi:hypothetical protein
MKNCGFDCMRSGSNQCYEVKECKECPDFEKCNYCWNDENECPDCDLKSDK